MSVRIKFITALCFVLSVLTMAQQADAQLRHSRQPLQAPMRWLGQGWSAGYHWQNSGPNSDYYNPYTAHNSHLLSQQPGYQAQYSQYQGQQVSPSVPYSVYAPTTDAGTQSWDDGQGQMIQPSFEPSEPDSDGDGDVDATDGDADDPLQDNEGADAQEGFNDDLSNISSDPNEPGSIRVDGDADSEAEDADFEESSSDEFEENQDDDTDVTNASFRRRAKSADRELDFSSFMVN